MTTLEDPPVPSSEDEQEDNEEEGGDDKIDNFIKIFTQLHEETKKYVEEKMNTKEKHIMDAISKLKEKYKDISNSYDGVDTRITRLESLLENRSQVITASAGLGKDGKDKEETVPEEDEESKAKSSQTSTTTTLLSTKIGKYYSKHHWWLSMYDGIKF